MNTVNGLTFKQWLAKVDAILSKRIGLTHSDLADFNSADCWKEEMTPKEGAEECLYGDDLYCNAVEEGLI